MHREFAVVVLIGLLWSSACLGDERWQEACQLVPGLEELLRVAPAPDFSPLGREGETVTLWLPETLLTNGAGSGCRKATFEIGNGTLLTEVPLGQGPGRPRVDNGSFNEVVVTDRINVYGPHRRSTTRDEQGRQIEAVAASPVASQQGALLQSVSAQSVVFGLVPVAPVAACATKIHKDCREADGSRGECVRCGGIALTYRSLLDGFGFGFAHGSVHGGHAHPEGALMSCSDCLPGIVEKDLERAKELLSGMSLYLKQAAPTHVLHRDKKNCEDASR